MGKCWKRLNSFAGKSAIYKGGVYLRHQRCTNPSQFLSDGVHLNELGNGLFLSQMIIAELARQQTHTVD